MKTALLNSIYYKLSTAEPQGGLQNLVNNYSKQVFVLFLDALDKAGIENLKKKIKVKTKFADGYVLESTFLAGQHMIETLFESEEYAKEIKELDQNFLNACECPQKEAVLHLLKAVLSEVGSESIDPKDWSEAVQHFTDCEEFAEEYENFIEF